MDIQSFLNEVLEMNRRLLAFEKPELLSEWDYEKNNKIISPDEVTVGSNKKVWWKCSVCGNEWQATIKNRVNGSGCKLCGIKSAHSKTKKTTEKFVSELKSVNPTISVIGEYKAKNQGVKCKCNTCGHIWEPNAGNLLSGSGCPICSEKRRIAARTKSNDVFLSELKKVNPNIIPQEEYLNEKSKITYKCSLCGNIWRQTPDAVLRGQGCPACNHANTSFFEKFIFECIKEAMPYERIVSRDRKTIGSELDVYLPDRKIAIEYGAWYWHKKIKHRDSIKREQCIENGIRLITIFDGCESDTFDEPDTYYFKKAIGEDFEFSKCVMMLLFQELNIVVHFSEDKWNELRINAYRSSRKKNTSDFISEMKSVNPNVEVLGEYLSSGIAITVKCKMCGYIWDTTPNTLLSGSGCPNCNKGGGGKGAERIRHDEFIKRINDMNSEIIILGEYEGSAKRIKCQCKRCNHIWNPIANGLMQGYGCPQCAKKSKLKSHEQFENEFRTINDSIDLLGRYEGALKPIECRCKICGYVWRPLPGNLLSGRGCPNCVNEKRKKGNEEFKMQMEEMHPDIKVLSEYVNIHTPVECECLQCGNRWSAEPNSLINRGSGCPKCSAILRNKKRQKAVINITTNTRYESLAIAEKETGISRSLIRGCCNGKYKKAKGFEWKFE